jgi:hypothetical protein
LKPFAGGENVRVTDSLTAHGHRNLRCTHETTLEITKALNITPKGDCIVAVNADKSLRDLSKSLRAIVTEPSSKVMMTLEVSGITDTVKGSGDPRLSLASPEDIVCRKSNFVSERTLMVRADKAAADIDRRIVQALKNPEKVVYITIIAEC